ncbi:hypothetical protein BHE74_00023901 [Ensete ventricosum]|nr:hypothetical protein BHE74_00023901 [Ensete ventricosum]RZR98156.1 hypothetical protein BHM03_00027470 [Ensete ventricosum]
MRTMWLGIHLECIEGSPRVSGDCKDGAREFTGRRPRLAGRLSGVAEKVAGSWEGRAHLVDQGSGQLIVQVGIGKVKEITFLGFLVAEPLVSYGCTIDA